MKSAFLPLVLAVCGAIAVPALANDDAANSGVSGDGMVRAQVTPARLIEFTGNREFLKESSRLRVWRAEVGYTLAIDPAGAPVGCELADKFRMNYVNAKLCEVLLKHHSFEPAHDATGAAIEGRYDGRLNFVEMRAK
jgi:hypothetical protein